MIKLIGFYDYTVILTYLSLFSAVFGMIQAIHGNYNLSVFCLLLSGVCDAFDGTVARTKKDRTEDEKAFGIRWYDDAIKKMILQELKNNLINK